MLVSSTSWTGRPQWAGSPYEVFCRWVQAALYPSYECEGCVGQDYVCYCAYYGGVAPNIGPEYWRVFLRDRADRWLGIAA